MSTTSLAPAVRRFLLAAESVPSDEPDAILLHRFEAERDEAAFATLVGRHGRMVFDVCRSVLGNHVDAEDAFQATFLVLARRAGSVREAASVANWLHGVAYRTARKALTASARRRIHESHAPVPAPVEPNDRSWAEVQQVLHEELLALPERQRAVLVLCYLQGMTQDRAAETLDLTKAAVKKRLERGRERLRERLTWRGLGPAAVLAAFASPAAVSALPPALAESAVRVAVAVDQVPAHVLTLADGGTSMVLGKFTASLLLVPALVVGGVLAGASGQPAATRAEEPARPATARTADDKGKDEEKKDTPTEQEANWLAGEWKVAFIEAEGKSAFPEGLPDVARITFKDGKAQVMGFRFLFMRDFTFKLDPTRNPKEIDVTFSEGPMKGETFQGIYVTLENEVRICLRLEHTKLGRPKGFSTVSGTLYTLFLRPVDQKDPPPKFKPVPAPAKPDQPAERPGQLPVAGPAGGGTGEPASDAERVKAVRAAYEKLPPTVLNIKEPIRVTQCNEGQVPVTRGVIVVDADDTHHYFTWWLDPGKFQNAEYDRIYWLYHKGIAGERKGKFRLAVRGPEEDALYGLLLRWAAAKEKEKELTLFDKLMLKNVNGLLEKLDARFAAEKPVLQK